MSTLAIKNKQGETVGDFDVADEVLVYDKGEQAVHEAVIAYQANQRAGTAHTLSKGEVAGAGSKPWRQKGTGRARAGYQQSPVWRGGAAAFGPRTRSFDKRLPRKVAQLAFRRALSEKISAGEVMVLDDLSWTEPSTREMAAMVKALEAPKGGILVVDEMQDVVRLSVRNLPHVAVTTARQLNVYEILRYPFVWVTRQGMAVLVERLQGNGGRKS